MRGIRRSYVIIITLLVLTMAFFGVSYSFFTSINEQHGKLNIVVGGLTYQLESEDLQKNKMTVLAGSSKETTIKLTSLNTVNSKYELYYLLNSENSDVEIGYSANTKNPVLGTIGAYEVKEITVAIKNNSSSDVTIEFSVLGGLVSNELVLNVGNSLDNKLGIYGAYNIGDEITLIDGSKWHVLEASTEFDENLVLLSDYNLNSDGTYNDECGYNINAVWACSPMAFDTTNSNIYDEGSSANIGYFIKNTYSPLVLASLTETTNITLPTAKQIAAVENKTFEQAHLSLTTTWLTTTNYWTKTEHTTNLNDVWDIDGSNSYIYSYYANSDLYIGIRPVITVPKNYIVETVSSDTELSIGTSVTAIDGSKWHVLEASNSDNDYVTLLSDYNLNSDGTYNTECGKDISNTYACSAMMFDSKDVQIYDVTNVNNVGYFIKNTYEPLVKKSLLDVTDVTLPTADKIAIADGQTFNQSVVYLNSSWLINTNYWTKTSDNTLTNRVWSINGVDSFMGAHSVLFNDFFGVRPVITTLKTNLLKQ